MGFGELLAGTLSTFGRSAALYLALAAVPLLPGLLLWRMPLDEDLVPATGLLLALVQLLLMVACMAMISAHAVERRRGEQPAIFSIVGRALARAPALLAVGLILVLALFAYAILFAMLAGFMGPVFSLGVALLSASWVAARLGMAGLIVVLEHAGAWTALKRSDTLSRGSRLPLGAVVVLVGLAFFGLLSLISSRVSVFGEGRSPLLWIPHVLCTALAAVTFAVAYEALTRKAGRGSAEQIVRVFE